ncbi:MAG: cobalamin-dependent protein [Oligoflexia bacterium]|nr:cobalamin-dependent protein [Oligoflexia bacterium]
MKKARVALINPPILANNTTIHISLGYLATSLIHSGHEVKIIDACAPYKRLEKEQIIKEILDFDPNFIGITLNIVEIPSIYQFIRELRKLRIPIVAGGPHANVCPEECLDHGVDITVLGEGEETIIELSDYFAKNSSDLNNIKGLCFKKDNGAIFRTEKRKLIEDLDKIPFLPFEYFPIRNYTGSDDPNSSSTFWSLTSSRGCPFNCIFCCSHNMFERVCRKRSAENVFQEVESLVNKYGAKKFAFQDDEILRSKKRILLFCDLIEKNNLDIKISIRTRIDSIDTALLKRMKQVGFYRISFGIECWNDDSLMAVNKKYTVEKMKKGFSYLQEANYSYLNFNGIIGFPWEKKEHLKKSLKTISQIPKNFKYYIGMVLPIPFPGTELYTKYHENFGFTKWWLDPKNHVININRNNHIPFFLKFTQEYYPLYMTNVYWKYNDRWKKEIESFCWKVFKLSIKRHLGIKDVFFAYYLSRISRFLWLRIPTFEKKIFAFVPKSYIRNIEKIIYYKQE